MNKTVLNKGFANIFLCSTVWKIVSVTMKRVSFKFLLEMRIQKNKL